MLQMRKSLGMCPSSLTHVLLISVEHSYSKYLNIHGQKRCSVPKRMAQVIKEYNVRLLFHFLLDGALI